METYAEVNQTSLILYPYTFASLQTENPYTNFGGNENFVALFPTTNAAIINGYTLEPVTILPNPPYDVATENCTQNDTPTLIDGVWSLGWTVTPKTPEEIAAYKEKTRQENKAIADQKLNETDWTAIPSVADPAQSNPYLMNQSAFLSYRSQVRAIAVNPPDTQVGSWPQLPDEQWSS